MVTEVNGRLSEYGLALLYQSTICFVYILPNPLQCVAVEEVTIQTIGPLKLM